MAGKRHYANRNHLTLQAHNDSKITEDKDGDLSFVDKAEVVLEWSWEIRDITGLFADLATLIIVQHVFTWVVAVGIGSILVGLAVVRLKTRKRKRH